MYQDNDNRWSNTAMKNILWGGPPAGVSFDLNADPEAFGPIWWWEAVGMSSGVELLHLLIFFQAR